MAGEERPGLVPGLAGTLRHTVRDEDCASAVGSGGVPVYSTPHMIALMERAALQTVAPHLAPGETTVGTRVEVEHLEACPPGVEVSAEATLLEADGRRLRFAVTVTAAGRVLGRGRHERFIVHQERFLARLRERWSSGWRTTT